MFSVVIVGAVFAVLGSPDLVTADEASSDPAKVDEVCYPTLGCFNMKPPFSNTDGKLPQSPQEVKTAFRLHTRGTGTTGDNLDYRLPDTISKSDFSGERPTKIILHGLNNNVKADWVIAMWKAFLDMGDFNVITVDWGLGAQLIDYAQAVANVRLVATQVKTIVHLLQRLGGLKLADLHLVGHSLGAHVSGYAGTLLGSQVGRISGLDPAEPNFETLPPVVRLDPTDAIFVDVMHTNGLKYDGTINGFGLMRQSGHVDFYINGGEKQPGCADGADGLLSGLLDALDDGNFMKKMGRGISCSHSRAQQIFIESMKSTCKFKSFPCENFDKFQRSECIACGGKGCSEAGYNAVNYPLARGKHYVTTFDEAPFCGEHYYHLHINHASNQKKTKGDIQLQLKGKNGKLTRAFSVFGRDTKKIGHKDVYTMMVLDKSEAELGGVSSVVGNYKKRTGYFSWFSRAKERLTLHGIEITEVETGQKLFTKKYFEDNDYTLTSGTKRSISVDLVPLDAAQS